MQEIPIPSMNVVEHNSVNENVKRMRVDVDDTDYRLAHSHGVSRPSQSRSASRAEPHVPSQDPSPNFSQPQLVEDGFDMGDELDGENEVGIRDNNNKKIARGENKVPHTAGTKTYSQHAYDLLQDGVSGIRDQASPQTHQGSSFASHEIEPRGNRTI